jgi:hypothetical protein
MSSDLNFALEEYGTNPIAAAKRMRQVLSGTDPASFVQAAIPLLRSDLDQGGKQHLLTLLSTNDLILIPLADPAMFAFDEAVAIASILVKTQPLLDVKIKRLFGRQASLDELYRRGGIGACVRLLEIMASIPEDSRITSILFQLLDHSDLKIRSKATLLTGRIKKNSKWVELRLSDSDARVRANAVESIWGVDSPGVREVLQRAAQNPDNRVAGNALVGLYRLGVDSSRQMIIDLIAHADPKFRVTAVWVMGETGDSRFVPVLARKISDADPLIRAGVFRSLARLRQAARNSPAAEPAVSHSPVPETVETGSS